ncbi:DUF4338 domain-containing protein [Desulfobacula sp.]|uniref:DUF4338 domain-containing protein n=1 Tax=Desulfobacula sp. TaxID=2593537 RepID=UPI0026331942|nr:DUF4338 domain-containing protein [Desulfobacula sp.]
MLDKTDPAMVCCGRPVTHKEIKIVQETVQLFSNLSRSELTETICEHLNWRTAAGSNKQDACLKMLEKLEAKGILHLPEKKIQGKPNKQTIVFTSRTNPQPVINSIAGNFCSIHLEVVTDKENITLWNEYMLRYHYLGYSRPFGYVIRYFINNDHTTLGCILFSGAAKSMQARDKWIGWTTNQRLNNLAWVINNSRFLIFPWVTIKNLASHTLGKIARRIRDDWHEKWGFQPVLMETFVDPQFFHGTCYQAANWEYLGMTTGKGLVRKDKSYKTSPKKIYTRPLIKDFRKILCSENLVREGEQDLQTPQSVD